MQKWHMCGYPIFVEGVANLLTQRYNENYREGSIDGEILRLCPRCKKLLFPDGLVDEEPDMVEAPTPSGDWTPGYFVLNLEQASRLVVAGVAHTYLETFYIGVGEVDDVRVMVRIDEARRLRGSLETKLVSEGDGQNLELRQAFFEAAVVVAKNFVVSVQEPPEFWNVDKDMAQRLVEAWELIEREEKVSDNV